MIPRIAGGWQTTMADLALILFIVSVAGLQGGDESKDTVEVPAQGEPLAVYSAREDAPPLGEWLADQAPDPRQRLTIVARYGPGNADAAARRALQLAAEADAAGHAARIILEQGDGPGLIASLAYDRASEDMARNLRGLRQD